jgi:hypothetical protein
MGKSNEKTNTGEGVKGERGRNVSDDESPERFFNRVGLAQTDLWGRLLDTTMIDLMWSEQAPSIILEEMNREDTHTPHTDTHYLLSH